MADRAPEPDDFGHSAVQTLARVGDPSPAREHSVFWSHWLGEIDGIDPVLGERSAGATGVCEPDPTDESCTHAFESVGLNPSDDGLQTAGRARIGCRVVLPPDGVPVRAGLVSTHGYGASLAAAERDETFRRVLGNGVAVLNIRVRGFRGSRLDTGDLQTPRAPGLGWITVGLDEPDPAPQSTMRWVYPQAVADVFQGCRVFRRWTAERAGRDVPLFLHGESFGGGLAVPAAAKLEGRGYERARVDRLVLALPTMGDWPWRLAHPADAGAGGEIRRLLERSPELDELIRTRLRLLDSVVMAGRIRRPVLCKLAERDEVVPAPTAAAVFNGLRVDPGLKWRFVVPHGHAETGLPNARRHAEFERCVADFLNPASEPVAAMRGWADRLHAAPEDSPAATGETASLFGAGDPGVDDLGKVISAAYERAGRTLDDLPYTDEYEQLWDELREPTNMGRRELFHKLHNMRKAGRLPRVGRAKSQPPKIDPAEEKALGELVVAAAGSLGQRDRLPYTESFDTLLESFNGQTGRAIGPHECWRLIAKLAK